MALSTATGGSAASSSATLTGGPTDGVIVSHDELSRAKGLYYAMAGWDELGRPRPAKLVELDLGWLCEEGIERSQTELREAS